MIPRIQNLYKNLIIDGKKEGRFVIRVELPEFMHVSVS